MDQLDREARSLGKNRRFMAMLDRSRRRLKEEGGMTLEEVRRRFGLARRSQRTKRK